MAVLRVNLKFWMNVEFLEENVETYVSLFIQKHVFGKNVNMCAIDVSFSHKNVFLFEMGLLWLTSSPLTPASPVPPRVSSIVRKLSKQYEDLSDLHICLIGATSEMGPMEFLLDHGATVIALARPGEKKWKKLIARAKRSRGRLIFPTIKI